MDTDVSMEDLSDKNVEITSAVDTAVEALSSSATITNTTETAETETTIISTTNSESLMSLINEPQPTTDITTSTSNSESLMPLINESHPITDITTSTTNTESLMSLINEPHPTTDITTATTNSESLMALINEPHPITDITTSTTNTESLMSLINEPQPTTDITTSTTNSESLMALLNEPHPITDITTSTTNTESLMSLINEPQPTTDITTSTTNSESLMALLNEPHPITDITTSTTNSESLMALLNEPHPITDITTSTTNSESLMALINESHPITDITTSTTNSESLMSLINEPQPTTETSTLTIDSSMVIENEPLTNTSTGFLNPITSGEQSEILTDISDIIMAPPVTECSLKLPSQEAIAPTIISSSDIVSPIAASTSIALTDVPSPMITTPSIVTSPIVSSIIARSPVRTTKLPKIIKTPEINTDQKRRISSRSIKRKRFDDEIVEFAGRATNSGPSSRIARIRTQSQSTYGTNFIEPSTTASTIKSPLTPPVPQLLPTPSSPQSTPTVATTTQVNPLSTTNVSLPSSLILSPTIQNSPISNLMLTQQQLEPESVLPQEILSSTPLHSSSSSIGSPASGTNTSNIDNGNNSIIASNLFHHIQRSSMSHHYQKPSSPAPLIPAGLNQSNLRSTSPMIIPGHHGIASTSIIDRRSRPIKSSGKKTRKNRSGQQITTKDLGRWKPIDDLTLIIGIQQTNDIRLVHLGTKFSCKFTVQEMQQRWYSLLYEEPISRIAVAAMRNLHPEIVQSVQTKALFSVQEEEHLGSIKSTDTPTLLTFQDLLEKNASVFYLSRTPKSLYTHWQLMKQYSLLPDQTVQSIRKNDCLTNFSDAEEQLNDNELIDNKDDVLEIELALADRKCKKEIRQLENELSRWAVLVDSLTGIGFTPEFDNQTLAVLRGRLVRYLMRSREITFGRTTKDHVVDVDLTLEGPAYKVSRRQGTIKLRSNGDFFISNEGQRPLFVDGKPLLHGHKTRLNNNCVLELTGLRFIFLINYELINAIRQESAKMSGPLA